MSYSTGSEVKTAPPVNLFDRAHDQICAIFDNACVVRDQAEAVRRQLFGSLPNEARLVEPANDEPSGHLPSLVYNLTRIQTVLYDIQEHLRALATGDGRTR